MATSTVSGEPQDSPLTANDESSADSHQTELNDTKKLLLKILENPKAAGSDAFRCALITITGPVSHEVLQEKAQQRAAAFISEIYPKIQPVEQSDNPVVLVVGGSNTGKSLLVNCLLDWKIDMAVRGCPKVAWEGSGDASKPPPDSFAWMYDGTGEETATTHCHAYPKDGVIYCDNPGRGSFTPEGLLSMQLTTDRAKSRRQVLVVMASDPELTCQYGAPFKKTLYQLTRVLRGSSVKSLAPNLILVLNSRGYHCEGFTDEEFLKDDLSQVKKGLEYRKAELRKIQDSREEQKNERLNPTPEERYAHLKPMEILGRLQSDQSALRDEISRHKRCEPPFETVDDIERMQELLDVLEQRVVIMSNPNDPVFRQRVRELVGHSVEVPGGAFNFRALYDDQFHLKQHEERLRLNQELFYQLSSAKAHLLKFEAQEKQLQLLRTMQEMYDEQFATLASPEDVLAKWRYFVDTYECPPKTRVIVETHETWGGLGTKSVPVERPDDSMMTYEYQRSFEHPVIRFSVRVDGDDVFVSDDQYRGRRSISYQHRFEARRGTNVEFRATVGYPGHLDLETVNSQRSTIKQQIADLERLLGLTPGTTIASLMKTMEERHGEKSTMKLMKSRANLKQAKEILLANDQFERWVLSKLPPLFSPTDARGLKESPETDPTGN